VPDHRGRTRRAGEVTVTPLHDREQDRHQLAARSAEPVLVPLTSAGLAVSGALDETGPRQAVEPA
jgi:hypothetical protein